MSHDTLTHVLDLARWAPSGDNTQLWRLDIVDNHLIRVHGTDTRDRIFYDYDGHPSHIAHGALFETTRIAAQWADASHAHPLRSTAPCEISPFSCGQTQMSEDFSHCQAFSIQVGWVTTEEQDVRRHQQVAIAGMGGAGGGHHLTLERPGIGKPKADVLAAIAKENNLEVDIQVFSKAVDKSYMPDFLAGVTVCSDGLDLFALSARQATFVAYSNSSSQAIAAAPFDMGTALLNFRPGKMRFEEYFRRRSEA